METHFKRALNNISRYGDTDVFPYPPENATFYDCTNKIVPLLLDLHRDFAQKITTEPPFNENQLAPVGYSGFRWVTQLDPLWNAYLLGLVISLGKKIESQRPTPDQKAVFSYRFLPDGKENLFDPDIGWRAFHARSLELAPQYNHVVICDIADFYPRIRHHRLENVLKQLDDPGDLPQRIIKFLGNFTDTYSHGLPIGGPAARLLSELLLSRTDRLLRLQGITFCRFADDYHLFASSENEAYESLLFLSNKLLAEGLTLQRSKTRIMSAAEFVHTSPLTGQHDAKLDGRDARAFVNLSLRFDPYSPTAEEDYGALKEEIEKVDILGMLREQISKSRIDTAITRKIVQSLKFASKSIRGQAILSICNSLHNLYPIFPNIMLLLKSCWSDLEDEIQDRVNQCILSLFEEQSKLVKTEINQAYACRVIALSQAVQNEELLARLYVNSQTTMLKRDIMLTMFNWRDHAWLSDLRSQFQSFPPPLRRAFIVSSYALKDEGKHWREHNKGGFSPFEMALRDWAASKIEAQSDRPWQVPL